MPPAAVAADKVVVPLTGAGVDPTDQVAATDRQTAAIQALVDELKQTREAFTPAADALHSLGDAQTKFCNFLVGNRLKIATGLLGGLVAVGAVSPNLAHVISTFLAGAGVQ